ncbi:MAG: phosphotransferase [Planctomycetaceae bacterium]|nr:phosphotransferase [Planctomycetaceae bacterium]
MIDCSTTELPNAVAADLQRWCDREFQHDSRVTDLLSVEKRSCSTIYRIKVTAAGQDEYLVCKRIVDDEQNRIFSGRGNPAQWEYSALCRMYQSLGARSAFGVPTPRAVFPSSNSFLMDHVTGVSVEAILPAVRVTASRDAMKQAQAVLQKSGAWLRWFQSLNQKSCDDQSVLDITLQHCDDRLQMIAGERDVMIPSGFRSRTLRKIEAWVRRIDGPVGVTNCHGDFGPWNLMLDQDRLVVFDFFAFRDDCQLTDLLGMLIYLESQSDAPSFSARRVLRLQAAFLQGFLPDPTTDPNLMAVCEAHQRIRRIYDCVMQRPRRWTDRIRLKRTLRKNVDWLVGDGPSLMHRFTRVTES